MCCKSNVYDTRSGCGWIRRACRRALGLVRAVVLAGQLMVVRDSIIVNKDRLGRYAGPACPAGGGRASTWGGHIQ
jgi:hypothetical protein